MKKISLRRYLRGRVGSGDCGCCGRFSIFGIVVSDGTLLCLGCLRRILKFVKKSIGGSSKVVRRPVKKKKFRPLRMANFSKQEIAEMSMGSAVKSHKQKKIVKAGARDNRDKQFSWDDA